ncbi:hypothetical protein AMATHDRAFT_141736, partial [Amanita thiersii Skay4041]
SRSNKTISASQPAFKPRRVKKSSETNYRDRAAERRTGGGNDYAEVEAVLEQFEKRHATDENKEEVENKRKYLGGDSDHSILVKGLDMVLLEANKAKAGLNTEDDEDLEKVFLDGSLSPQPEPTTAPKKRTREEIIRELKKKRGQTQNENGDMINPSAEPGVQSLEEAKKAGKFKPIGFKPISEQKQPVMKKKAQGEVKEGQRKKKKRKIEGETAENDSDLLSKKESVHPKSETPVRNDGPPPASTSNLPPSEPEPILEDFDIFADVGEYQGLDLGDEDENDGQNDVASNQITDETHEGTSTAVPQRWIPMDEDDLLMPSMDPVEIPPKPRPTSPCSGRRMSVSPERQEEEEGKPMRLQALSSSALPSIKDFLAMDEAAQAEEKRRKRKEKKKAKGDK